MCAIEKQIKHDMHFASSLSRKADQTKDHYNYQQDDDVADVLECDKGYGANRSAS